MADHRGRLVALSLLIALGSIPTLACGTPTSQAPTTPQRPASPNVASAEELRVKLTPFIASVGAGRSEAFHFSGIVFIASGDEVLYEKGFGFADRSAKTAIDGHTNFRIGSVSKPFTATAVMKLVQDGKMDLDARLATYLPDYEGPAREVTVHQLLSHTAGVPSYTDDPAVRAMAAQTVTTAELLDTFDDRELDFEPGTSWAYSNSGYVLLGAIIERVSGKPYADFMADDLFDPMGLARTRVGDAEGLANRAQGYRPGAEQPETANPIDMSFAHAAGAVRSTARDLWTWHKSLRDRSYLNQATYDRMVTEVRDDYAYGWMVRDRDGKMTVAHNGLIDGFSSWFYRVPSDDLLVVVLSNNTNGGADLVLRAALAAVRGDDVEPLRPQPTVALAAGLAAKAVGRYRFAPDVRQTLVHQGIPPAIIESIRELELTLDADGSLWFKLIGQGAFPGRPTGDATLAFDQTGIQIRLDHDDTGVQRITLTQGKLVVTYEPAAATDEASQPAAAPTQGTADTPAPPQ